MSGTRRVAALAHVALACLFVACLAIQTFLIGLVLFDGGDIALHRSFGIAILLLAILVPLTAGVARLPTAQVQLSAALLGLTFFQMFLAALRWSGPSPIAALHPVGALLLQGECAAGGDRDHRAQVADHADVGDAGRRVEVAVVEGALHALREAVGPAHELAGEAVEQVLGVGPPAVRLAEAETGESARRVEVDGEDRPQVAVQGAEGVARPQGQARGHVKPARNRHRFLRHAMRPAPDYTRGMKMTRLALLLLSLALVAACGTKGPLVMPDKADQTEPPAGP